VREISEVWVCTYFFFEVALHLAGDLIGVHQLDGDLCALPQALEDLTVPARAQLLPKLELLHVDLPLVPISCVLDALVRVCVRAWLKVPVSVVLPHVECKGDSEGQEEQEA
jgi:hypothetical protein